MNSLLPSSVFSPKHLHSNWEIWAFSCFSARSCQPFPLPKRGLVVVLFFFFPSPSRYCLCCVTCSLLCILSGLCLDFAPEGAFGGTSPSQPPPELRAVAPQEQIFLRGCSLVALGSPKLLYHSFQFFFFLADPASWSLGAARCVLGAGQPLPKAGTGEAFEAAGWPPPCSLFFPAASGLARLALGWPGQLLAWQCPARVRFAPQPLARAPGTALVGAGHLLFLAAAPTMPWGPSGSITPITEALEEE